HESRRSDARRERLVSIGREDLEQTLSDLASTGVGGAEKEDAWAVGHGARQDFGIATLNGIHPRNRPFRARCRADSRDRGGKVKLSRKVGGADSWVRVRKRDRDEGPVEDRKSVAQGKRVRGRGQ